MTDDELIEQYQDEIIKLLRRTGPLRRRDLLKLVKGPERLVGLAATRLAADPHSPVLMGPGGYRHDRPAMIRSLVINKLAEEAMGWKQLEAYVGGCRADTSAVIKEMLDAGAIARARPPRPSSGHGSRVVFALAQPVAAPRAPEQLELPTSSQPASPRPHVNHRPRSQLQESRETALAELEVLDRAWAWWFDQERPERGGSTRDLWDAVQKLLRCQRPARR